MEKPSFQVIPNCCFIQTGMNLKNLGNNHTARPVLVRRHQALIASVAAASPTIASTGPIGMADAPQKALQSSIFAVKYGDLVH
jgi:hypothetical protein